MATKPTLNVSLTPEHERFILKLVASGDYQTASEVVRAALRLLRRAADLDRLPELGGGTGRGTRRNPQDGVARSDGGKGEARG